MISVEQALKLVLKTAKPLGVESIPLYKAIGRVLGEDIFADRPMPPFDRVTMDGIAISYDSFEEGRTYPVEAIGPAGSPQLTLKDSKKCIEIMTGASLPSGTDTVIRYEDLENLEDGYKINASVKKGQNVHTKGSDHAEAAILLKSGTELKAVDINILATVGKSAVDVYQVPRVAVISSGDELVDVGERPASYQIRKSNVYMIASRLLQLGVHSKTFHFKDEADEIYTEMETIMEHYDVLLMSGGVSKGKFDFIPEVLDRLGFTKVFHKVAQRPGKPFWFGVNGEKTVFAFPGNPVSTLACFQKYFLPWLGKKINTSFPKMRIVLAEDVHFKPNLTYFAQAIVHQGKDGRLYGTVKHGNGSGDIVNPSSMDGFVEIPAGKEIYSAGEMFDFRPFHPIYK